MLCAFFVVVFANLDAIGAASVRCAEPSPITTGEENRVHYGDVVEEGRRHSAPPTAWRSPPPVRRGRKLKRKYVWLRVGANGFGARLLGATRSRRQLRCQTRSCLPADRSVR